MAENKKSVVFYVDNITVFEALSDDEAGRLIKHYLRYVNDLNPEPPDRLTQIIFEPIKQQLKRDLVKWEEKIVKKSESGREGGKRSGETRRKQAEAKRSNTSNIEASASKNEANEAVNVTVTVNDTVTIKKENSKKVVVKKTSPLPNPEFTSCIEFWLKDFHPDWTFSAQKGKALKSIITKIKTTVQKAGKPIEENTVLDTFRIICERMPEFFKNKDLDVIDSKFNEIVEEIKKGHNETSKHKQPSAFRTEITLD